MQILYAIWSVLLLMLSIFVILVILYWKSQSFVNKSRSVTNTKHSEQMELQLTWIPIRFNFNSTAYSEVLETFWFPFTTEGFLFFFFFIFCVNLSLLTSYMKSWEIIKRKKLIIFKMAVLALWYSLYVLFQYICFYFG